MSYDFLKNREMKKIISALLLISNVPMGHITVRAELWAYDQQE